MLSFFLLAAKLHLKHGHRKFPFDLDCCQRGGGSRVQRSAPLVGGLGKQLGRLFFRDGLDLDDGPLGELATSLGDVVVVPVQDDFLLRLQRLDGLDDFGVLFRADALELDVEVLLLFVAVLSGLVVFSVYRKEQRRVSRPFRR